MDKPKRIYFLFPVYLVGGGETYVCRMIEYLLAYTDIKIGIIDFSDGMLSRTCKKFFSKEDIHYVDYNQGTWMLNDDSIIFAGADHLGCIKPLTGKNIRIQIDVWEAVFGWDILFEKKTKKAVAKLLKENNGTSFIDIGCYLAACKQLKQEFKQIYMPLFYYTPKAKYYAKIRPDNEINLVWLGRFAGSKLYALYNIIDNFANYKTSKKKIFHLIGNGPLEDDIKNYAKKHGQDIKFIFTGVLTGKDLTRYLQENADVGVAMGTSTLNIGALSIPVIMAPQSVKPITVDKFLWLSDMEGGCCGTPLDDDEIFAGMYKKLKTFESMMDDCCDPKKRKAIGEEGYKLLMQTYGSITYCGSKFLEAICQTTLTFEKLKKVLKFLPYNDKCGLAVQTYKFLGLPLLKIKHHGGRIRFYFLKIPVMKFYYSSNKAKYYFLGIPFFSIKKDNFIQTSYYILNIKIVKSSWWGRYSYYESTNDHVKEECKNKYAISERILFPKQ